MGPSGGRPALRRGERAAACCRCASSASLWSSGYWEETGDGESMSVPCEHRYHDGLLDLYKRDVFTLFRDGIVEPQQLPAGRWLCLALRDEDVVSVRPRDLLVRDDERQRFEAEVLPTLRVETTDFGDFSDFWHNGRRYRFTPTQARVLRFLARRGPQREPLAVRQGGARRQRLELAEARRSLQAPAGVAGPGRGRRPRLYRLTAALTQRRAA